MPRSASCGVTFVFVPESYVSRHTSPWSAPPLNTVPRFGIHTTRRTLQHSTRSNAELPVSWSRTRLGTVASQPCYKTWAGRLEDRRRDIRLALFFKAVHGLAAVPTTDTLTKADKITRSNHTYKFRHIPTDSTAYRQSFFPRTVPQWNSLPPEAVTLPESLLQAVTDQSTWSGYPNPLNQQQIYTSSLYCTARKISHNEY